MTRLWSEGPTSASSSTASGRSAAFMAGAPPPLCSMVQQWQVDTDWWAPKGGIERDYFAVTTGDGMLVVLYHDRLADEWWLSNLYD